MNLYMKQKVFSWGDKFNIYDETGGEVYFVRGEVFSLGKKLHIEDLNGRELAFIQQKLISFLPKYYILRNSNQVAEVVKKFTIFKHKYIVNGLDWTVEGNFTGHEFSIKALDGRELASVHKKWLSWGDTYEISIALGEDAVNVLAVVLVIDACIEAENNAAQSASSSD